MDIINKKNYVRRYVRICNMSVNQFYILIKKYYILMSMITECQNEVKTTLTLFIWILCYYINKKTDNVYANVANKVGKWFDTPNYGERRRIRSLPKWK